MSASSSAPLHKAKAVDGPRSHAALKTQLPLIMGFLLLLAVAAGSVWLLISSHRFNESVAHTLRVRSSAYRLLTLLQDAETGQRGFIITSDPAYLRPYEAGAADAPKALADLRTLTLGHDVQSATIERLSAAMTAKLGELARTIAMVKGDDVAAAVARVKENVGNNFMETIRAEVQNIETEEEREQSRQTTAVEINNNLLAAASLLGIVIVLALAGYSIVSSSRTTKDLMTAQGELRATNENLEGLVADRVSELQIANEEIQRFAYIVSHDLRAPLVNVMGFTSELDAAREEIATFLKEVEGQAPQLVTPDRRMAVETDLPEALGFIRSSTAKMDRLINAILKLSREGRRVLTPEEIDLPLLIAAQGESLSHQLAAGDAELTVQSDLPKIVSDRLAIEQIFGNLIENATKYLAPDRPGRIDVKGRRHGAYIRYDISDNGRGIDAKDFERIFELFRRSGEQNTQGEGIGLAYVRNLARRLGGNVTVESEIGKGSTFTVTLPSILSSKARST